MQKAPVRTAAVSLRRLGALLAAGVASVALFGATPNADAAPAAGSPSSIAQTKSKPSLGYCDRCARGCKANGKTMTACDPDQFGSCRCSKTTADEPTEPSDEKKVEPSK